MLSIIIPTFKNRAKINLLLDKLFSIKNYDLDFEVIVVNDDINEINIKNKKVILIEPLKNNGGQYARGLGLKKTKYDNIFFLDDDDEITHNFFKILKRNLNKKEDWDLLMFNLKIQNSKGKWKIEKMKYKYIEKPWLNNTLFQNKIYKKKILKEEYFTKILLYQDENIFFKSVNLKTKILMCDGILAKYNYNYNSVSKNKNHKMRFDRLKDNYEEFKKLPGTKMHQYARGRLFSFLVYWNKLGKLNQKEYIKKQDKNKMKFTADDRGRLVLSKMFFWR